MKASSSSNRAAATPVTSLVIRTTRPWTGRKRGPNLYTEGARHSRQWEIAHYADPQAFVPKSIMPVFPFSDSQRAALALYDTSFIPRGARPVSPDQDLPTAAMTKQGIVVPQVRYMTR